MIGHAGAGNGGSGGRRRRGRDELLSLVDAAARAAFLRRLGRRAYLAASLGAAVWGAAGLTAAIWDYGAATYYAILLSVAGLAWPILAWPPSGEPFAAMVRAMDTGASIESYLSARNRGRDGALKAAALATLRTADARSWEGERGRGADRPGRAFSRRLPTALLILGLALFVAAQAVSLRAGMGYGLGYPDRSALVVPQADKRDTQTGGLVEGARRAEAPEADESGEVIASPRAGSGAAEGSAPLPERQGTVSRLGRDPGGGNERPPEAAGTQAAEAEAGQSAGGGRKAAEGLPEPREPREGVGPAGYEGTGRSLTQDPLGDYRARIERLLSERGGLERALGELSSPALAQAALEAYYGSFERRIRTESSAEIGMQALRESWAAIERERAP